MGRIDAGTLYGTLNVLVLQSLQGEKRHGLGILKHLESVSGGALAIEEGALYPALHRLERDGLIEGTWGKTPAKRRAKFYCLTPKGQKHLSSETEKWARHAHVVAGVLNLNPAWGPE